MYQNGEISEAEYMTYTDYHVEEAPPSLEEQFLQDERDGKINHDNNPYPENDHPYEEVELVDVGADLTQEDKVYLAMK